MKDWLLHAGWNPFYPVVLADEGLKKGLSHERK